MEERSEAKNMYVVCERQIEKNKEKKKLSKGKRMQSNALKIIIAKVEGIEGVSTFHNKLNPMIRIKINV